MMRTAVLSPLAVLIPLLFTALAHYFSTLGTASEPEALGIVQSLWGGVQDITTAGLTYDHVMRAASRSYFIRPDLMFPQESPHWKVLETGNDYAYIQLVRTNKAVFDQIMAKVDPEFTLWRIGFYPDGSPRTGPQHMLDSRGVIALTLSYLGSTTQAKMLELVYGVGHSILSRDIRRGMEELVKALRLLPETTPTIPNTKSRKLFAEAIEGEHGPCPYPGVKVWGFLDGLRLEMKEPWDQDEQTLFYNGWIGIVGIVNTLLFTPDGKIAWTNLNAPGSLHDYSISNDLFDILAGMGEEFAVAGDSAFMSDVTNKFIASRDGYKPPQGSINNADPAAQKLKFRGWISGVRQSVEHGMRSFQAMYSRIKIPLSQIVSERRQILEICVRLHNLNAHYLANHNQVTTLYLEHVLRAGA